VNVQSVAAEVAAPATSVRTRHSTLIRGLAPFVIGGAVLLTPTPKGSPPMRGTSSRVSRHDHRHHHRAVPERRRSFGVLIAPCSPRPPGAGPGDGVGAERLLEPDRLADIRRLHVCCGYSKTGSASASRCSSFARSEPHARSRVRDRVCRPGAGARDAVRDRALRRQHLSGRPQHPELYDSHPNDASAKRSARISSIPRWLPAWCRAACSSPRWRRTRWPSR